MFIILLYVTVTLLLDKALRCMIYTQTMHDNYIISSKLKNSNKIVPHYIMLAQFNYVLENVCRHMPYICTCTVVITDEYKV